MGSSQDRARPRRHDAARAKLVAQKAKGMPRITILLSKLVDAAASEAVANLSLELYKSLKNVQNLLISGGALFLTCRVTIRVHINICVVEVVE